MASGNPASDSDKEFPLSSFLITLGFHAHLLSPPPPYTRIRRHCLICPLVSFCFQGPCNLKLRTCSLKIGKPQLLSSFLPFSFLLSFSSSLSSFFFFLFSSLRPFFSVKHENCCCLVDKSCLTPLPPHGLEAARFLCP